jgi:hypothetical protein
METKAYLITEEDIDLFIHLTGYPRNVLESSLGWVVVVTPWKYDKSSILPRSVFDREYPGIEFYQRTR